LSAMRMIAEQMPNVVTSLEAREVWKGLFALVTSRDPDDWKKAVTSTHGDNVRAFLVQRGPPYRLTSILELDNFAEHLRAVEPRSSENVVDLTLSDDEGGGESEIEEEEAVVVSSPVVVQAKEPPGVTYSDPTP
jgi:hypothetical protein